MSLDLKKMDYLALDDRHGQGGKYLSALASFLPQSLLKTSASVGPNEKDITEDSTHGLSDETDHILSLLQKYPVNETAAEANVPLA